jgi:hypothetical protein
VAQIVLCPQELNRLSAAFISHHHSFLLTLPNPREGCPDDLPKQVILLLDRFLSGRDWGKGQVTSSSSEYGTDLGSRHSIEENEEGAPVCKLQRNMVMRLLTRRSNLSASTSSAPSTSSPTAAPPRRPLQRKGDKRGSCWRA